MKFKALTYRYLAILAIAAASAVSPVCGVAASKWETPRSERTDARSIAKETDIEIKAARGVIIITTNRPTHVKVFTILGQLVSSETIPAGTSQLPLTSHGVYIIKTSELTCKVAV